MKEEEIEAWYEAEKERLTKGLMDSLAKTKEKDVLEKKYKEDMKKLHSEYEKRMEKSISKRKERIGKTSKGFFKRFFKRARE